MCAQAVSQRRVRAVTRIAVAFLTPANNVEAERISTVATRQPAVRPVICRQALQVFASFEVKPIAAEATSSIITNAMVAARIKLKKNNWTKQSPLLIFHNVTW